MLKKTTSLVEGLWYPGKVWFKEAVSGAAWGLVCVFLHGPGAGALEVLRMNSRVQALMLALSFPKIACFIPQENGLRTEQEMWVLNYSKKMSLFLC